MSDMQTLSAVPNKFKQWFIQDRDHRQKWEDEARECYDFVAGRQWSDEEISILKKKTRPIVTFNRTAVIVDSIHGHEVGNRRQVRYIPRELGDVKANELLTGAAQWFRDQSHADEQESDSFLDMIISGLGWTETRLDLDDNPAGEPSTERIDPFEMYWDFNARQRNLADARRVWRVRQMPLAEAKDMFPEADDTMLDANWAEATDMEEVHRIGDSSSHEGDNLITVVQCQWIEKERYWLAYDPLSGEEAEFTEKDYATANKRMKRLGMDLQGVRASRKVRKQAFFGKVILKSSDAPCPKEFSLQAMTGKRDRNTGLFYGVVRAILDPQKWANKWLSQVMHIMNTNSKGGLMAEKGAFENQSQAEQSWAESDAITWMQDGAMTGGKVKEKPPTQFPAGFQHLTDFAISSIRDVSGVSVEMLGMREANQAASLEAQRRQAGMTILQPIFDALKFYRERQGRVLLHYIQNDLSDGRLVRITGESGEQYVPLIREAAAEYDIIIDDMPTSPNQKEQAWALMMQLLPMIGANLPPEMLLGLMEYSPLPSDIVQKLQKQAEEQKQSQAPMQQAQLEQAQERHSAEIGKIQSETQENAADAAYTVARAENEGIEAAINAQGLTQIGLSYG